MFEHLKYCDFWQIQQFIYAHDPVTVPCVSFGEAKHCHANALLYGEMHPDWSVASGWAIYEQEIAVLHSVVIHKETNQLLDVTLSDHCKDIPFVHDPRLKIIEQWGGYEVALDDKLMPTSILLYEDYVAQVLLKLCS